MRSDDMWKDDFVKRTNKWIKESILHVDRDTNILEAIQYMNKQLDIELDNIQAKKIKNAIILMLKEETDLEGHPVICACNTFEDIAHGQRKNFLRRGE
jgi:hypothetical protein